MVAFKAVTSTFTAVYGYIFLHLTVIGYLKMTLKIGNYDYRYD